MKSYVIEGGKKLSGRVKIECAKNALLPILAGSILTEEEVIIKNFPQIKDAMSMLEILKSLGCKISIDKDVVSIDSSGINSCEIPSNLTSELRSSVFMLGGLISRFKKAKISLPGGCKIGARPVDMHIDCLKKMGADIREENGVIICEKADVKGGKIWLKYPSVGVTENLIMASVIGNCNTTIFNAAEEPEIKDLACFLNKMGAKVIGGGTKRIDIYGVKKLHGVTYSPISDRIEMGTYLVAGAITGGEIEISGAQAENIFPIINKFCDNTCKVCIKNDIINLKSNGFRRGFKISTGPYPEFPTDMQPQMTALATVSRGVSAITENVFENRFGYLYELIKMGAKAKVVSNTAIIKGVSVLHGEKVFATDLRGGASLVLAGLNAEGTTTVCNIEHIERGYFEMCKKLASLGASIKEI